MEVTSGERWRPTFIVIGPGRSATTWMYRALELHPEVCVASAKETFFFDATYHKGENWYSRFFKHCDGTRAVGEVSNTYIFYSEASERIHRFRPEMRLISSLRNPIDRAFSHYLLLLRNGQVKGSFEAALDDMPNLLQGGKYSILLEPYLDRFPRDQLLILIFDRLRENPREFARRVYEFVGADPDFWSETLTQKVLPTQRARILPLARLAKWGGESIRAMGFPEVVTKVKAGLVPKLLFTPYEQGAQPELDPQTRSRLEEYYSDEVDRLADIVGEDLRSLWF